MNLSLSEATEFGKAKTPGVKVLFQSFSATIFMKTSMYIFTETIPLFVCFLPVVSSFRIRGLYLSVLYIFVSFTGQYNLQNADCRLQTGLGTKCRLGV